MANESDQAAALAGAVLARATLGPFLLPAAAALPAHVPAEAACMEPQAAYLVGETPAPSSAVSEGIRASGVCSAARPYRTAA